MESLRQIKPVSTIDTPSLNSDIPAQNQAEATTRRFKLPKFKKIKLNRKKLGYIGGVLAVVLLLITVFFAFPAYQAYKHGKALSASVEALQNSFSSQDIAVVKSQLVDTNSKLITFEKSYRRLVAAKFIPKIRTYYNDGVAGLAAAHHGIDAAALVITTIEPYADIVGLAGPDSQTAKSGEDTANDRIQFIIETIHEVLPKMDEISQKASLAQAELSKINPADYPENFRGKKIRSKLQKGLDLSSAATQMLSQSKPLLEAAPYLLGIDEERTYLLLFQNDKELRPTGGFITAYSIMNVNKGKLNQVSSSDIYNLDSKYKPSIEAPQPIRDYLKGPYLISSNYRLRDMNWSPDFAESMKLFTEEAGTTGLENYDGIISVDTHVLVKLLDVLGEIGVPGFGNFSTKNDERCNCPQVIYELESFADVEGPIVWSENEPGKIVFAPANYDNRKKIVGPLMNSVLSNALGQPKEKLPGLFLAAWESITEKHIMVYLFDEKAQAGAEGFNIAGKIKDYDGDYLHVSDANLGGRKSNLYVTQEVHQQIKINGSGEVEKTVEITYKNPQSYDGWLNSVLPNWTRVYVPEGSELVSSEGFDKDAETYTELGKTVFAGGFQLRPQGVQKITLTYKLPNKFNKNYKMLIQKQPGTDMPLHTVTLGRQKEEFFLTTDRELTLSI
jgi:hypothetical protein